ncbi:phosphoglycerate dehydrogenase [Bacillus dakarensis]|uniref:phosphoglycerate dehydrogenase n=1 Tax=Robertmurraya dakarensis TaxID=1926278 RepID=UPI000980A5BD|nr:phosphoglycerate dehydrogenase [Bacillus dakarensis]
MKILFMLRDAFYDANPKLIHDAKLLGAQVKFLYTDHGIDKKELIEQVKDVDIIVVAVVKIDQEVIDAAPQLKYIIKYGAGYDNIDVEYAFQKGIPVTNAPGQNAESVADHAFGLMLTAARKIPQKHQEIKADHWELSMGNEIYRKRLGIIGFGSIGQAIARRAAGFNMETICYGNYKDFDAAAKWNVSFVDLNELFSSSDFIIISTSLSENNRKMVNKETLSLMKPTAFIINISRGGLIDEGDLVHALKENKIRGAALDVFEKEPPTGELAKLPNVIATPHIGGATFEAIERIGDITITNIKKFMDHKELKHVIAPKTKI